MEYRGWEISVHHGEGASLYYCISPETNEIEFTGHDLLEAYGYVDKHVHLSWDDELRGVWCTVGIYRTVRSINSSLELVAWEGGGFWLVERRGGKWSLYRNGVLMAEAPNRVALEEEAWDRMDRVKARQVVA